MSFKSKQNQIAKKQGISKERAGAILGAAAQKSAKAHGGAKHASPKQKKVLRQQGRKTS